MDGVKKKKSLFLKTWQSIQGSPKKSLSKPTSNIFSKSKSCPQVAPEGCFSVYVGPEKQRFVVKAQYANHPLFKMLLEDAEMEYGYCSEGPLLIPCEVDLFYKVLAEMEMTEIEPIRYGFVYGPYSPFNPARRLGHSDMAEGRGSYGLLTPSRMLKMNQF